MAVKSGEAIEVGGRRLKIGHLDRVVFSRAGVTKGELLDYYVRAGDSMLAHLCERQLHMHRTMYSGTTSDKNGSWWPAMMLRVSPALTV